MQSHIMSSSRLLPGLAITATLLAGMSRADAAPVVTRLTPPSVLFSNNDPTPPITSRFLSGQRFDLQATISPDAGKTITSARFLLEGNVIPGAVTLSPANATNLPEGTVIATLRAFAESRNGVRKFSVRAAQDDGQQATAEGNFRIVRLTAAQPGDEGEQRAKNIIILIGDGLGIAHRTAARIMLKGVTQGKSNGLLAMDTFPFTGMVTTHSLNSIVTDSSPGAACYSTGNKSNNNQHGVFPDDTNPVTDDGSNNFDNPRVELISEYFNRTQKDEGPNDNLPVKSLGIVTTSDVFDATPAAFGSHTQNRGAGTGIVDQYFDDRDYTGLTVLLGGGRKWFLPNTTPGSARSNTSDYVLPDELANAWQISKGTLDPERNLIADFRRAGFAYAPNASALNGIRADTTKLLGLFSLSNMNVALDKINGRRGDSTVVNEYGFPNQPMLDEMTDKALQVLSKNQNGFVLMVEGASIDKQAHNMDTERWLLDTLEFDRAVAKARDFAARNPDTLVVVTADHECAGINIIGSSRVTDADLAARANSGGGAATLREPVVGLYETAGFPHYDIAADGYPVTTDVDFRMLIGYAANADRFEDWRTNARPIHDSQQPFDSTPPLSLYPRVNSSDSSTEVNASRPIRDQAGNFLVVGQVPGSSAAHTASDIPISAFGRGEALFTGVMDNTSVFFKIMQASEGRTEKFNFGQTD